MCKHLKEEVLELLLNVNLFIVETVEYVIDWFFFLTKTGPRSACKNERIGRKTVKCDAEESGCWTRSKRSMSFFQGMPTFICYNRRVWKCFSWIPFFFFLAGKIVKRWLVKWVTTSEVSEKMLTHRESSIENCTITSYRPLTGIHSDSFLLLYCLIKQGFRMRARIEQLEKQLQDADKGKYDAEQEVGNFFLKQFLAPAKKGAPSLTSPSKMLPWIPFDTMRNDPDNGCQLLHVTGADRTVRGRLDSSKSFASFPESRRSRARSVWTFSRKNPPPWAHVASLRPESAERFNNGPVPYSGGCINTPSWP